MRTRIFNRIALIVSGFVLLLAIANLPPQRVSAQSPTGTIAYAVEDDTTGDQIWLINPDGSHNRKIYQTGVADQDGLVWLTSLAWRPDAGELVFSSNHEEYCSWYNYDVYAIAPDGSGSRRVTNSPNCAGLANLPQGSVTLNSGSAYGFDLYIQGAIGGPQPAYSTVTFDHVADLGASVQPIVVFYGDKRAMGGAVDVKAGQAVSGQAGVYSSLDDQLGAYSPVWKRDGSKLAYAYGCNEIRGIADHPNLGEYGQALFNADGMAPCVMAYGPTAATANDILYFSGWGGNAGIFHTTEGGGMGTAVIPMQDFSKVFQIQYLPDASGFIYTSVDSSTTSNIYRYDFQSKAITQLTDLSQEYARDFAISPDGKSIVFERAPEELLANFGGVSDLWMMGLDGSDLHLLVKGAAHPTWTGLTPSSSQPPQNPPAPTGAYKLFLPLVKK